MKNSLLIAAVSGLVLGAALPAAAMQSADKSAHKDDVGNRQVTRVRHREE